MDQITASIDFTITGCVGVHIQRYLRALDGLLALTAVPPVAACPGLSPPPPLEARVSDVSDPFSARAAPSENAMSSTACTESVAPGSFGSQSNVVRSGTSSVRLRIFSDLYLGLRSPSAAATRA